MKTKTILFIFSCFALSAFSQNLIQNPSFDQNDLSINCSSWYNRCNEPMDLHCDSNGYCMAGFSQQSPSVIPENRWCVKIDGGFPNGLVYQHFTGLQGTLVFKMEAWYRAFIPVSTGMISIGKTVDGLYQESKNQTAVSEDWTVISMTDTLTLEENDSLTILLEAELGDFIFKQALFDDVSLEIIQTLAVDEKSIEHIQLDFDAGTSILSFKNKTQENFEFEITNLLGQAVYKSAEKSDLSSDVDLSFLKNDLYLVQIKQGKSTFTHKIIKL